MESVSFTKIQEIIKQQQNELLASWLKEQAKHEVLHSDLITKEQLREQSGRFLELFAAALQNEKEEVINDITSSNWEELRSFLKQISRSRNFQGFTPSETAQFIFSLKHSLATLLQEECSQEKDILDSIWPLANLLDTLGLYTCEMHIKAKEEVIAEQQQELLELSTPVIQIWESVLALPLIGTLDSSRTQIIMESLLQKIVETRSNYAIIDITGVPTVDTLVAQHLLKTVAAARLMGAECIISGIRPQIAQTIVQLGIKLDVATKATLADAFELVLDKSKKQ